MNIRRIEILSSKYFEGHTSLEEETELRKLLMQDDVPEKFRWMKSYFLYTTEASDIRMSSEAFDQRLINRLEKADQQKKSSARKFYMYVVSGVAASILIIFGLFTLVDRITEKMEPDMQETEVAYQQASKALLFVSSKLNSGVEQTKPIKTFNENINKMEKINLYSKGLQEFSEISKLTETPKKVLTNK